MLLAEFIPTVAAALKIEYKDIIAYSDSTLVLRWVQSQPYQYKNFIGNRIAKIQEVIQADKWGFVQGTENPADCASRGISVTELLQHKLWWTGPTWLKEPPVPTLPLNWNVTQDDPDSEKRQTEICNLTVKKQSNELFYRYSSLTKLQRVVAYIMRFINNSKAIVGIKKGQAVK